MGRTTVMARSIAQAAQDLRAACDGMHPDPGGWVSVAAVEFSDRLVEERSRIVRLAGELDGVAEQLLPTWQG